MTVRIITGDVLAELPKLPAGSVHCCVTSPPYWNLRDYGLPPSIWGGQPQCEHRWDEKQRTASELPKRLGQFCRCGAWRGCLGLEPTPELFVKHCVAVFSAVRRVLRDDGTLWLNIGDSFASGKGTCHNPGGGALSFIQGKQRYPLDRGNIATLRECGLKPKDLVGVPWMLAFALRADGWYLRSEIIWHKPNPMPESVADRPTRGHEQIFLLSKSPRYFYDLEALRQPPSGISGGACFGGPLKVARAKATVGSAIRTQQRAVTKADRRRYMNCGTQARSVWTIPTFSFREAHFATFPPRLVERCIKAGTSGCGCCPRCGAPWRRIVERTYENPGNRKSNGPRSRERKYLNHGTAGYDTRLEKQTATIGWRPGCDCPNPQSLAPIPCVVLDPFGGAGTTGLVADRLGRDAILIDLNPQYTAMANRRISADAGMFADVV